MMVPSVLAVIGGLTLILTAATRIPGAVAELLRACIPVIIALRDLRANCRALPPYRTDTALSRECYEGHPHGPEIQTPGANTPTDNDHR